MLHLCQFFHFYLFTWGDCHTKYTKDKIHNEQNIRSGELSSCFYETDKNSVKRHVCHIHCTAADMNMAKMCPYPSQHHGLPHWKCVLLCCNKCPSLIIHLLDTNKDATNKRLTIHFHLYINVSHCTMNGQHPQ